MSRRTLFGLLAGACAVAAPYPVGYAASDNTTAKPEPVSHVQWFKGAKADWEAVGPVTNIINNGPMAAYGTRLDYFSNASAPGFDLATADIAVARASEPNHTNYLSHWFVQLSPLDESHFWSATIAELNPVNRGNDPGWTANLGSLPRFTGGLRVVPETTTFKEPGTGRNIEFSYAIAPSGSPNTDGDHAATYNGLMIEANSIAAGGRGVLAVGASAPSGKKQLPETPLEVRAHWRQGLTTVGAEFDQGDAIHIGTGQAIALTDDGQLVLKTDKNGQRVQIVKGGKRMMTLDIGTGDLYVAGKIVQHSDGPE